MKDCGETEEECRDEEVREWYDKPDPFEVHICLLINFWQQLTVNH